MGRAGVHRVAGVKAVGGALLVIFIPEIAALPDAMAQAGEGANGSGVVAQHILRIMAGSVRPTYSLLFLFDSLFFRNIMSGAKDLNIFSYERRSSS